MRPFTPRYLSPIFDDYGEPLGWIPSGLRRRFSREYARKSRRRRVSPHARKRLYACPF